MEYTTLGRTGLKVSVAGLGCGGFSRLGLGTGKSEADAIAIIREALELGVNLFDTAAAYGTEPVLGKALARVTRDQVVICTKAPVGVSNPDSRPARAVATLLLFAVRNIFSRPERLAATMHELAADGLVPQALADNPDPLGFLVHEAGASSVIDAAYRFVRHEPGVNVVLFGTGDCEHLH